MDNPNILPANIVAVLIKSNASAEEGTSALMNVLLTSLMDAGADKQMVLNLISDEWDQIEQFEHHAIKLPDA